jgi:hypothetical protein
MGREGAPSGICDGLGRDDGGCVHCLPQSIYPLRYQFKPRCRHPLYFHGLAALVSVARCGTPHYSEWKNLLVWNKTNAGQGSLYRSKHELVAVFKSGNGQHINNFGLGAQGRYRTNVLAHLMHAKHELKANFCET